MIPSANNAEYSARVNHVIDYIQANLDQPLSLDDLADVANFSKYHFHRIFQVMVGETLHHFIQRLRVEKAANQLIYNTTKSITEIALDCGFSGSATFARAFKEFFGVSASEWRSGGSRDFDRKNRKVDRNNAQAPRNKWQAIGISLAYNDPETNQLVWRITMFDKTQVSVEVREQPEMPVAYVRHIGPYQGDSDLFGQLFQQLITWAAPRGLLQQPEMQMLAVYHDDPEITADENLRVEVCMTVPPETEVDGPVGKMTIPGGSYAVGHFELRADDYAAAWQLLYGEWLPQSGYQPDDRPPFERFLNNPEEHPEHKHIVEICVPVKPL